MKTDENGAAAQIDSYIIHLKRACARAAQAEALRQSLAALPGCARAAVLPAADAQNLTAEQISAVYRRKIFMPCYPFPLKRAEIACFLSHRAAWEALLAGRAEAAFISEDDMSPRPRFAQGFALARAQIKARGLIRFPHRDREKGAELARAGQTALICPRIAGLGAVAYMLSREAAARLLAATRHFDRPLDVFLQMFWISGVRAFALVPGGAEEISARLGGSTLTQKRGFAAKMRHELARPLYRAKIALLSLCRSGRKHS